MDADAAARLSQLAERLAASGDFDAAVTIGAALLDGADDGSAGVASRWSRAGLLLREAASLIEQARAAAPCNLPRCEVCRELRAAQNSIDKMSRFALGEAAMIAARKSGG